MSNRASNVVLLLLWSLALFGATVWLHTRHNDFPYYYHPDEPGKVEQVMGKRPLNFHHPNLMLGAAKLAAGSAKTEQRVVETGRLVSAAFTAGAVVALSLLAYLWQGWLVGMVGGVVLMLHHQLFELSHYMKEDPALLFGVAVTFLALHLFDRRPTVTRAALVGVGCGLAISGKYIGVIVILVTLPVLLRRRVPSRAPGVVAALLAMVGTVVTINLPLLMAWGAAQDSMVREARLVVEGQGLTQSVPHTRYWNIFLTNTTPVMWVLLLATLWAAWRQRREMRAVDWVTLAFPFAFALGLSFSPKENDRYFLPATALFTLLATAGLREIVELFPRRLRQNLLWCELGVAAVLIGGQFINWTEDRGGFLRYWQAFQHDDTAELTEWLRTNLPPGAVIAKDEKVRLPDEKRNSPASPVLPFKVLSEDYAADVAPSSKLEDFERMGVSYVVITDNTFKKFERQDLKPKEKEVADYERRKEFYISLRRDFVPEKDWNRGTVIYLHPGIEVYHLTGAEK
jgi:hypothetical protein